VLRKAAQRPRSAAGKSQYTAALFLWEMEAAVFETLEAKSMDDGSTMIML
jgi:hypothetical protein